MGIVEQYLLQLNKKQQRFRRNVALLTVMSLLVMLAVSWNLRQTGITLANDAACGIEEHRHTDECILEKVLICGYDVEEPTQIPAESPTEAPTEVPTELPTETPTEAPTEAPTELPTEKPTEAPTEAPTELPTEKPTEAPTEVPTELPTEKPTEAPTETPTELPTEKPTEEPTEEPTELPTEKPTEAPTEVPTELPTEKPTEAPTEVPTELPTEKPTEAPTEEPTELPTEKPTEAPTEEPTELPTEKPTEEPTEVPTEKPTEASTEVPTEAVHVHSDECYEITYQCGFEEHIHDFSCYPDLTADLEDWDIWAASIPELTGRIAEDIVLVAQSQLGNMESTLNYELSDDGQTRNGISRYGQWYGNPYGAWSNMFTSFCLRYAGLTNAPINSGAEAMRLSWEEANLYRYAGGYEPLSGDIVFLDKNQNGTPESTAVVVRYFDFILTVIEGDVDNSVVQQEYRIDDPVIVGYGVTNPRGGLMFAAVPDTAKAIGHSVAYSNHLFQNRDTYILYTVDNNGTFYAIDGNGKAVEVTVDGSGVIYSDVDDPSILYWKFSDPGRTGGNLMYAMVNVSTGKALHPYNDSAANNGVLHTTAWQTVMHANDTGVKLRGNNQNWYAVLSGDAFGITNNQNSGSVFYFGEAPKSVTLWLDGTNGNIMSYRGSDNTKYTLFSGTEAELPSEWKSPTKYSYKLAGWVNIQTGDYYLPGDTIVIEEDTVLYADWVASTYDIGQYNSLVADTISTNDFITTHVFDYSSLINLLSTNVQVTFNDTSHSESWTHVGSGNLDSTKQPTLNFSFNDHDTSGMITNPSNRNPVNTYTDGNGVRSGIYDNNENLGPVLFGTNNTVVGKHYLGTGDHLFQINTDPTSEYYGYYYYDAKLNAASYNQTDQRFYVYEYLARTTDSAGNNDAGKYSDFLPLNSPYANTNGQALKTYNYAGANREYEHVAHYEYDARYDTDNSNNRQVKANLWFGMRTDIQFFLPDKPGSNNGNCNLDLYGKPMRFEFTGDDDIWILVDGVVVLDLGGIHQAAEGEINFSTGTVTINNAENRDLSNRLKSIEGGEPHTLTILYLERGSSMSNCSIYFNLAPQFALTLQKEDVLSGNLLNGATFAFYEDPQCQEPCVLWASEEAFQRGEGTNEFVVKNGKAYIWGLNPSHTYYIRETSPPVYTDNQGHPLYNTAKGVIRLKLDKTGVNSSSVAILEEVDENGNSIPISEGFTTHDFRIDDETQSVYLTVTNAQNWITETTSVYVKKYWDDTEDHSHDSVTVYLNVTENGEVSRIREATLSKENNWSYLWTNLPKYPMNDENVEGGEPLVYTVTEAYVSGYVPTIEPLGTWYSATTFENGGNYLLRNGDKYLSATDNNKFAFVDEATAKSSGQALWTATVGPDSTVSLTNQLGKTIRYDKKFVIAADGNHTVSFKANNGIILYSDRNYLSGVDNNGNATKTSWENAAMVLQLEQKFVIQDAGYAITNTPLSSMTSLKVHKQWDKHGGNTALYEKAEVPVKLLANGEDTGRTETISLKSNWEAEFIGLPYLDEAGNPIEYTVEEVWETYDWTPSYGHVTATDDEIPTYDVIVTNVYRWADARVLPATGGIGYPIFVLCGLILVLAPLVYGLRLRRRYRKGAGK